MVRKTISVSIEIPLYLQTKNFAKHAVHPATGAPFANYSQAICHLIAKGFGKTFYDQFVAVENHNRSLRKGHHEETLIHATVDASKIANVLFAMVQIVATKTNLDNDTIAEVIMANLPVATKEMAFEIIRQYDQGAVTCKTLDEYLDQARKFPVINGLKEVQS